MRTMLDVLRCRKNAAHNVRGEHAEMVQKYVVFVFGGLGDKSSTQKHKHTWPSSSTVRNVLGGHSRVWIPIKSFGTIKDVAAEHIFNQSRPRPIRPITVSQVLARPGPSHGCEAP